MNSLCLSTKLHKTTRNHILEYSNVLFVGGRIFNLKILNLFCVCQTQSMWRAKRNLYIVKPVDVRHLCSHQKALNLFTWPTYRKKIGTMEI